VVVVEVPVVVVVVVDVVVVVVVVVVPAWGLLFVAAVGDTAPTLEEGISSITETATSPDASTTAAARISEFGTIFI
jgi:hypothetical protein